ncbi:MAG: diacylglycerol kinase family protein, partial [Cyclobacteriaceae bacterium]
INKGIQYFVSNSIEDFDHFFESKGDKYKAIVICGGDGTLNSSLKHIAKNKALTLAVLPNGSGDGFASELGFKKDIRKLINQLTTYKKEAVDLIQVNDDFSCNMTGIGFDSYVATEFAKRSKRGLSAYIYCTLRCLLNYKPITAKITTKETTFEGEYFMINIANTRQFGNNALIAPEAKYNNGFIELVLVKKLPFYSIPSFVFNVFKGNLQNSEYVQFHKVKELQIETTSKTYHVDGEPKELLKPLQISMAGQFNIIKTA